MGRFWLDCELGKWVTSLIVLRSPDRLSRTNESWVCDSFDLLSMGRVEGKGSMRVDPCTQPMKREFYPSPMRVGKIEGLLDFCCPWVLFSLTRVMGTGFSEAIPSPIQERIALCI